MTVEISDEMDRNTNFSEAQNSHSNEYLSPSAKEKGNEEYNNKEYEKAIEHWLRAYRSCCYILSKNVYSDVPEKDKEIRVLKMQLDTNLSIAYLKLQDYSNAIHYANKALEYEPSNLKALHHKSVALFELCEYQTCIDCTEIALKTEPNNSLFKKIRYEAALKQKQYISKSKRIVSFRFFKCRNLTSNRVRRYSAAQVPVNLKKIQEMTN
ncbi:TPR repeat protein [Cryptosporidium canis]|uniref:TPR repeat protein n=1 Tax=Cryptosporidium canis TaxID=195482 RepID=A0ABQ8P5D9_9CRYT|nr:TPR repeat protein [Cryptosporidium canis]KAJ1613442.1 TPR repeat protein [Cryptosporidium canis]